MKATGTFRLSFNRAGAAPRVWSVALVEGDDVLWELAVPAFGCDGVQLHTVYRPKATPDDEDGKPSAWLECAGELEVLADGSAVIRATDDDDPVRIREARGEM